MKNLIIILGSILLIVVISSCKKEELIIQPCGVNNPLENIPWLKTKYEEYDYENDSNTNARIYYYKLYDGRELINISFENIGEVYDCAGNSICSWGGIAGGDCYSVYSIRDIKLALTLAPK